MSSPGLPNPGNLLYDVVKEARRNKTLREAIEGLRDFHLRLNSRIKILEATWNPADPEVFRKVISEDVSADKSALAGEKGVSGSPLERSWSWNSIEEWVEQVKGAVSEV